MPEVKETTKTEEKYTEIGKVPVYKRSEKVLILCNFVGNLKDSEGKVVGDICNGMNGDIILKVNDKGTYTVHSSDLLDFVNKLK